MTVRIADLGEWGRRPILAEYEPRRDIISVNARIVKRLRAKCGAAFAARFIVYAIWHELGHALSSRACRGGGRNEADAHAFAERMTGITRVECERAI